MVAPKNISANPKEKSGDVKSKSPSPEPFQEPDGMTTIDLNKSDDYSNESELEKAELKRRAQVKYLAQLLFALGSILVIVLLIIMMTFLDKEYHLFTIIPLKINQSHPSRTNGHSTTATEEFFNITNILNQERFLEDLKTGKYVQQFPLEMDLCKLFKSAEFCCDVFRHSEIQELLEFCTVSDMLNYLIDLERNSIENQQINDQYPKNDWKADNRYNLYHDIGKESHQQNTRNKRHLNYDPWFQPELHSNSQLDLSHQLPRNNQPIDQYQPLDQYQSLSQYRPPKQHPLLEYQNQYLQAPHIPSQPNLKFPAEHAEQTVVTPQFVHKTYKFPENMISEIERSHHDLPLENLDNHQAKPWSNVPQTIEQFESFGMGQQLRGNVDTRNQNQNIKPWIPLYKNNDAQTTNKNWKIEHQALFHNSNENNPLDITDGTKLAPRLQSVLKPLPQRVRDNIFHHVTVLPKLEHVYKSSEFQTENIFDQYRPENSDFEDSEAYDPGRLSNDDGRSNVDYRLKVNRNGEFDIDSNKYPVNNKQKEIKNIDRVLEKNDFTSNTGKHVHATGSSKLSLDKEERIFPSQTRSQMLGSSLDSNGNTISSQSNKPQNLVNENPNQYLDRKVLPDLIHNVLDSKVQNFKKINDTKEVSHSTITNFHLPETVNDHSKTADRFDLVKPEIGANNPLTVKQEDDTNSLKSEAVLKNQNLSTLIHNLEISTEISTLYITSNQEKEIIKSEIPNELNAYNFTTGLMLDQTTILSLSKNKPDINLNVTATSMEDLARFSNIESTGQPDAIENSITTESVTRTSLFYIGPKLQQENKKPSKGKAKAFFTDPEINQKDVLRSNTAQDVFRGKQKSDTFTASEDIQSNQQTYINPCYNPYMSPYIPFMPPAKVGSTQDGYLKVVSVSSPHVQNQPMYVLNPSMYYGFPPNSQHAYPTQNPFLPQGFFPQAAQSPYAGGYNSPVQVTSSGGQYYVCNPIPTPTNNIAGLAGVEVRRDASNLQSILEEIEDFGRNNKSREATTLICPLGEQACLDNIKCIKHHHVCDSEVHCDDSSDEIGCTCKERVGKLRLCDGYCDCPTCEDEQGCFGCEEDEYSCDDWSRFRRSTCVPISQRCDGTKQCEITGKDEMDCSILADHIGNFPLNKISNAVGFLHRNFKGKWYPTCFGTELWAAEVCQVEAGPSAIIPKAHMTLTTDPYNGLFINILPNNKVSLVNTCVQDRAAFVECPPIYCGLRFLVNNPYRKHEVDTDVEDMLNDLERAYKLREDAMVGTSIESDLDVDRVEEERKPWITINKTDLNDHSDYSLFNSDFDKINKQHRETRSSDLRSKNQLKHAHLNEVIENLERTFRRRDVSKDKTDVLQQSRVVGGKPSQPAAWPWLISIYKNGIFHCGGVLINELWIVTASHCVDRYWQYYYEIQAGVLRRFSYSPMDQRRWAKMVVPHERYSKRNLRNDIALMKLSAPLRYNKYIRPICLPSEATAGQDFLKGPSPGSVCTTVGWGATVEHGADPDHMREVEVPILQHCKHKEDSDVEEVCAGLTDGGKDACQGDSGGPLMCRNPNNPNQWYLAGIVSHGEGCARPNEPGVYTKVSRYMGWIAENTREDKFTMTNPLQKCPGYVCKGTTRCVPKKRRCDRIIDCLLGDDEINCEDHFRQLFKHSRKSITTNNNEATENFVTDDIIPNLETVEEFGIVGSKRNDSKEEIGNQSPNIFMKHEPRDRSNKTEDQEKTKFQEVYFKCQMMLQVVRMDKRCDKVLDCEDGTDELNCTCTDYIKNIDPRAICDGISDCPDLSDEQNCVTCNHTDYTCRLAQKCIDATKRCDGIADCPQNEDEMNCASLTNGHALTLDRDNRPMFKSRGIVTINRLGKWKPLCLNTSLSFVNDEPSIATVICNALGFGDYFSYHQYLVENRTINVTHSSKSGRILSELENKKCGNCCEGLYISCSNTSVSTTLQQNSLEHVKELYFSPWTAAIYSNGHYMCTGTLLNHYWVVTSVKCFIGITILQGKYVVAVFGRGKINLSVRGPHEQIIRIVESITVNETDIVLLRLDQDVKFNRYVQAANLNVRKDGFQIEKCYAVGQDNENKVKFVSLYPIKNCLVGFRCFAKKIEEPCTNIHTWSGTIICDSRTGWYPAAVFNEPAGHCGLHHEKKYTSVKFYKNEISRIMVQKADSIPPPVCDGLQCNLGNCIPQKKVCDGVVDCHSGEDEKNTLCYEKEKECYTADNCVCPRTHLKCPTTHKCFPKSSFCDRVNNCGEFEDEPEVCSCRNYLKLTNPDKICDGILHCMDRSDEDPDICACRLDDFQCGKTSKCVPQDLVCDNRKDCPNGEDEATCLSLNSKNHDRTNAGEVMTRTAGVWHSGCFDLNYSTLQLEEICYKLGFSGGSANQLTPPSNITTLTTLRPVLDSFDLIWLRRQPGNKFKLRLRTGHDPYVTFVHDEKCHRLFIACI